MSASTVEQALENIYASLHNNNEGLDEYIAQLKESLAPAKEVTIDAAKIPVPNREGRKTMQAYFKKRGVVIDFKKPA